MASTGPVTSVSLVKVSVWKVNTSNLSDKLLKGFLVPKNLFSCFWLNPPGSTILYLRAAAGISCGDLSLVSTGRRPDRDETLAPIVGTGLAGSYI